MSDFDGGIVVARTDVDATAYRVVRDYLTNIGESHDGRTLVYTTGRGMKALWIAIVGGPSDGKGRMFWHQNHAALAGELAKALRSEAWAWGREDQVGTEFVVAFDATGRKTSSRSLSWDDVEDSDENAAKSPVDDLGRRLGSWEADEGATTAEQPLDAPFDPEVLSHYLLAFSRPEPAVAKGTVKLSVFLTRNVLDDATKLAKATGSDLGTVFWAAWESAKGKALEKNPNATDGTLLELPVADPPAAFKAPKKKPPALSGKTNSTADMIVLFVPAPVEKEVRTLAVHAGVKYDRVVDYVYLLAREALWSGEGS